MMTREEHQEALDELVRERTVRERIFPRWVEDGRLSHTEKADRMRRLNYAITICKKLLDLQPDQAEATGTGAAPGTVGEGVPCKPGQPRPADGQGDDVPF